MSGGKSGYRFRLTIERALKRKVQELGDNEVTFEGPVLINDRGHPRLIWLECDHEQDRTTLCWLGAEPDRSESNVPRVASRR